MIVTIDISYGAGHYLNMSPLSDESQTKRETLPNEIQILH